MIPTRIEEILDKIFCGFKTSPMIGFFIGLIAINRIGVFGWVNGILVTLGDVFIGLVISSVFTYWSNRKKSSWELHKMGYFFDKK